MCKKKPKVKMTREFMEFVRRKLHGNDGALFDEIIKQLGLPALPPRKTKLALLIEKL